MIRLHQTRQATGRRGSIYLAVLGVAIIVSMIGLTTMQIARLQLRSTRDSQDLAEARLLSQSGVEFGLAQMEHLSDWRVDRSNSVEMTPALNIGNGTMTYVLADDDGDFDDDLNDKIYIVGIGRVGGAVCATRVLLEPIGEGVTSLESSLHSDGDLVLGSNAEVTNSQTVSSNGDIDASASNACIAGEAWAVGNIVGNCTGVSNKYQSPAREMPDAATVFEYYVANGTQISFDSIPGNKIEDVVISPGNNPYGAELNPEGIYVIDCQGGDLQILYSRIHGTLVILNAGSGLVFDKHLHWESALANYPALMVQGSLEMKFHGDHTLNEALRNINYNPADSPYQDESDTDKVDEYPGVIKGLIYVSGDLAITNICNLEGVVVVGGATSILKNLTLKYDLTLLSNPPPGFTTGTVMQIVPGTWTRIPY